MKGSKIKVQYLGADIVVVLPYKNGIVKWALIWMSNYTYNWRCIERPVHYRPERVEGAHKQYLNGKILRGRMIRAAAANHVWWLLDKLRNAEMYQQRLREMEVRQQANDNA